MPYWNRRVATDRALALMASHYPDLEMEVVIVDDGSEDAYYAPKNMPWPILIKRLPPKSAPKSPCLPINVSVFASSGEYVALSNPETLHRAPILSVMREAIREPNDYVIAACWAPESKRWHAHSSIAGQAADGIQMPANSCLNFLSLMHRSLWDAADGFDSEYRNGHCYEDTDFVKRLERAGANFILRDDLIVDHPRQGARSGWDLKLIARNRTIFQGKWRTH